MKEIYKNKSMPLFLIAIPILIVIFVITFFNSKDVKSNSDWVEHTYHVDVRATDVLLDVVNRQTSIRGFLLTGEEAFLNPFYESINSSENNLNSLLALTQDNPSQKIRINSIKELTMERLTASKKIVKNKQQNILKESEKLAFIETGKIITDKIRNLVKEVKAEEFKLLERRKKEQKSSISNTNILFFLLLGSLLSIFAFAIIIFRNQSAYNKELSTNKNALNQLSKYSNSLLEASLDPLFIINTEGKIRDMNLATINVIGLSREAIIDTNFFDYFTESQNAKKLYQEVFAKGFVNAYPLTVKDHKLTNVLFNGSVYKDGKGTVIGAVVVARDITEQVIAHQKIEESEHRYHSFIYSSPSMIAIFKGENFIIELANDSIIEMWNKGKDVISKPFASVMPETVEQGFYDKLLTVYKTGVPFHAHETPVSFIEQGKPRLKYFTFIYQAQLNAQGEIEGVAVIGYEVTQQVEAKNKLKESEYRYSEMIYSSPNLIAILKGKDLVIEIANDTIIKIWGKGSDVIGKKLFTLLPELLGQGIPEMIKEVYNSGNSFSANEIPITFMHNEKQVKSYYSFIFQPQRTVDKITNGIAIIALDVTKQALLNLQIKESEERFRSLADNIPMHVFIIEPDTEASISYWNKNWLNYTGLSFEEAIGNTWGGVMHADDVQSIMDVYVSAFEKRQSYFLPAIRVRRHDGEYKWHSVQANPRYLPNGEFIGYIGIGFEIHEKKLAEDALKESETFNRTVLESSPDCVKIIDTTGRIQYMNTNGMCIMEIDDFGSIKNKPWSELWGEDNKQVILDAVDKAIGGETAQFQAMCATSKGTTKWWDVIVSPVHEARSNKVTNIISVSRDITEQKATQSLLNFRKSLLEANNEASIDGILLVDAKGKILSFNKRFIEIWNMPQHIVDANDDNAALAFAMTQLAKPEQFIEKVNYLYKHPTETTMDILEFKDGKMVERYGYPVIAEDGNQFVWSWSFRDISEQKRIEKELIDAKVSAENAVKSKQQFLSNMSHEIRTPLNSIVGFTNVLLKTELAEKQKDFIQAIKTSSNALNVLINDILDLAKVNAGKMTFVKESFGMHKSIESIIHTFDLKIKEKNIELIKEFDSEIPSILVGDSVRLNQIILNLMSNAIKFTHKGKIILSTQLISEDEENIFIEFTVTDTGIGIAADKTNSIFNLFEQAEITTSNSYGGTGLGLAIVKQLTEAQGGSISVKSKLGEGSRFTFILPFGKAAIKIEDEIEPQKQSSEIKNLRVLVAEDVALNQLLIKIILDDFGFEHEVVNNGKIAIEKLQTNAYDIILMDLQMPEMNGFEATEYIRKTMKSNIPIIALTADVTTVDVAKCQAFGMNDYASKPIDENQLYSKIMALISMEK